jgi:hypothetical protein
MYACLAAQKLVAVMNMRDDDAISEPFLKIMAVLRGRSHCGLAKRDVAAPLFTQKQKRPAW